MCSMSHAGRKQGHCVRGLWASADVAISEVLELIPPDTEGWLCLTLLHLEEPQILHARLNLLSLSR